MSAKRQGFDLEDLPEVQRRLLRAILREERERAGLTQKQAADLVLWSLSKLIRVEMGTVPVSPADARTLLLEYKATPERLGEAIELANAARRQDELAKWKDILTKEFSSFIALERAAYSIQKYEASFVPGLLQTREYAMALLIDLGHSEAEAKRLWELRALRQQILDQPDGAVNLDIIIGEAALSRPVGGTNVMRRQVEHLKVLHQRENITLQYLPFRSGAFKGMGKPFTILQFRDPRLPDLLFLEDPDSDSISRDERTQIKRFQDRFWLLKDKATPAEDFAKEVDQLIEERFAVAV